MKTSIQAQIIELFGQLSQTEQIEILKKMSANSSNSISISEFAQKVQHYYGTNIEFSEAQTSGPDHMPVVTIDLFVPYGKFSGKGSNQKIAKANAIAKADAKWPN
ncbi:MAG: hypothetical protein QG583_445 [Patescibacteria group bacterium]|nr:hypothetical protein [Patescibacteria group bacterium]